MYKYTYIHINIYIHMHMHIYVYTHTYIYVYTCINMYIYTYVHVYTSIHAHICIFICTHICIYKYIYIHICIFVCMYICICMYMNIFARIHMYVYIYIYVHTYICICIYVSAYMYACKNTFEWVCSCFWLHPPPHWTFDGNVLCELTYAWKALVQSCKVLHYTFLVSAITSGIKFNFGLLHFLWSNHCDFCCDVPSVRHLRQTRFDMRWKAPKNLHNWYTFSGHAQMAKLVHYTTKYPSCHGAQTLVVIKRDLEAASLWPALEYGCGKHTSSAR